MRGDTLASGGRSATFPAAPKISQEAWDKIWEEEKVDFDPTPTAEIGGGYVRLEQTRD